MDSMNINAAFVGGGNMGGALIRGLIARGMPAKNIRVGEAHQPRRISLADELGVHVTADNREAVTGADVVVLAVKPQDMADTVQPLADVLAQRKPLVISIAAGIRVADIESWCGRRYRRGARHAESSRAQQRRSHRDLLARRRKRRASRTLQRRFSAPWASLSGCRKKTRSMS